MVKITSTALQRHPWRKQKLHRGPCKSLPVAVFAGAQSSRSSTRTMSRLHLNEETFFDAPWVSTPACACRSMNALANLHRRWRVTSRQRRSPTTSVPPMDFINIYRSNRSVVLQLPWRTKPRTGRFQSMNRRPKKGIPNHQPGSSWCRTYLTRALSGAVSSPPQPPEEPRRDKSAGIWHITATNRKANCHQRSRQQEP